VRTDGTRCDFVHGVVLRNWIYALLGNPMFLSILAVVVWIVDDPDLTVHLHRLPEGEWVCLDATTVPWPSGMGLAESALHDLRGPIGRSLQSLVVDERREG
jgi:hypothetical protein